jgi:hypothetical protein
MHEMLCSPIANEFDNRMLQEKNQLRAASHRFDRTFPLIYSKFIREENYGQNQTRTPQPLATERPEKYFSRNDQPLTAASQPLADW